MRLVRSLLAVPSDLGVAPRRRLGRRTSLRLERLVRGPRLQKGAIDREVVRGEVATQLRLVHDRSEELIRHLRLEEALTVLGERGGVEGGLVDAHVQEPLEQQDVVEPFAERPGRIEYIAINTVDFNNVSGGTLRRPPAAYMASKVSSSSTNTASTTTRIRRIG